MGLMDVLRKLGIVQSGAVATTYSSGKDRPIEFSDGFLPDNEARDHGDHEDSGSSPDAGNGDSSD